MSFYTGVFILISLITFVAWLNIFTPAIREGWIDYQRRMRLSHRFAHSSFTGEHHDSKPKR